ncbi:hypothetical protein Q428_01195 [Fervidicella metallireducens AeB]|uniref:Permease n=1 Tax=Fervidicella metallireducens AeB TaxID=1403537 RepID=A0A017RYQ5_9CLOT|nr:AI-2E family transporter [Fervidicella metallireducens]EYE89721.1 hypothetical protein Q428_01195 [Fervidicella metallireducens AeB]
MLKKISIKYIIIIVLVLLMISLVFISRTIIKPIVFSAIMAYILNPLVKLISGRGIKKKNAVLISLALLLGIFILIILYVIPGVIKDVMGILSNIDKYNQMINSLIPKIGYDGFPVYLKEVIDATLIKIQEFLKNYLSNTFSEILNFTMEIPTYALTPIFIYYFLIDSDYFSGILKSFFSIKFRGKMIELWHEIDKILGSFIRSQIILSIIIAGMTFVALSVMKVKYAIIIALINGITNIIPYFGPIIGFLPAFFIAASESLKKAVIVSITMFIIQEIESSVIAPKLMGESLGIHPVFIMIVLILGGKYFGAWGLVLSVPLAGMVRVTYRYIIKNLF